MKFLCSNCKAKYQIADEKVAGRTLRMTCRRCREEIVIHGDGASASGYPQSSAGQIAAPPPAPSPLGADFQQHIAAHARAQAPVAPILDEWHVGINDVPVGPMRRDEVARKLAAGAISAESLAWREGLDDWLPIRQIPELAVLLQPMPGVGLPPPALPPQGFAAPQFAPPPPPAYAVAVPPPAAYAVAVPPPAAYAARQAPPPAQYAGASPLPPQGYVQTPAMQPAQRAEMAPIGGRAGAAAGYGVEEWAPVVDAGQAHSASQVALNQLLEVGAAQRRLTVSMPVMFALASGFALLTSGLAIWGARMLVANQTAAVPAAAPAAAAAAPAPAAVPAAPARVTDPQEPGNLVNGTLEDPNAQAQARAGAAMRGAPGVKPGAPKSGKKELTEEQKAMLARMGGSDSAQVANLKTATGSTPSSGAVRGTGGLTSEQFSKVVLKGRESLQRCYETALRGTGSTDTVRMDVEIMVSPNGNVTSVKTSGQGLQGMGPCIERTVRMWRFPNAAEASGTHFPLLFQPGS